MIFLELLISTIIYNLYDFNFAIQTFVISRALLSNSLKQSLLLISNLLIYLYFGFKYVAFAKLYLVTMVILYFHEQLYYLITNKKLEFNIIPIKEKIREWCVAINALIALPFYILYDNINSYFNLDKYLDKFKNNYLTNTNDIITNAFDTGNNQELDNLLADMLNPDKMLDMANNMRNTVGKEKLSMEEINTKMTNFSPLMEMLNKSLMDLDSMMKNIDNTTE